MTTDRTLIGIEAEASGLVARLPDLLLEAQRVAFTVAHGLHGRRRAGPGETFWQFRQLAPGDAAQGIDWRRSANSEHLYAREREWEAAHTVWLWPDLSPSMRFKSHLATIEKRDRALVMAFALSEMLVGGAERVAFMGLTQPSASRKTTSRIVERLGQTLATNADPGVVKSTPPEVRVQRFSSCLWISDFLDPVAPLAARIAGLGAQGVTGHLVQVLDPAEETLPYSGRTEFLDMEGDARWISDRAEGLKGAYIARLAAHKAELQAACSRAGWSLLTHRTDRPATEPLLALVQRLRGQPVTVTIAPPQTVAANSESEAHS